MSPAPDGGPDPQRLVRTLRRAVLLLALSGGLYLFTRYTTLDLPSAGCSPVWRLAPGQRVVVDTWAHGARPGDVVLFRTGRGTLGIGRVLPPPGDGSPSDDQVLVGTDDPSCPGWDPVVDGPVRRDDLVGRVILGL